MSPVEEFILDQPEHLKSILKKLHRLIISTSPFLKEKLVYGIPFYYGTKRILYINPKKQAIELGFCKGYLLAENSILETKNRTEVKTISFGSADKIIEEEILPLIHEAILIDQVENKKEK